MRDVPPLPFPGDDEQDELLRARLASSYAALPAAGEAQVSACAAAVLRAARSEPRSRARWWWGAAAAAVLVVVVSRPWRGELPRQADRSVAETGVGRLPVGTAPVGPAPVGSVQEDASGAVHFAIALPAAAREVSVVGDFNGWDERATPMVKRGAEWSAKVALPPGRHVYAFVVDGAQWLVDPLAPQVPDAGYGPANAVIVDPR